MASASAGAHDYTVVLIPLGTAALGGAERSLLELASELRRCGVSVRILAERTIEGTQFGAIAAGAGIPVEWVDWAPERGLLTNFLTALRVFRRNRADIIHVNMCWRRHMWAVALAARLVNGNRLIGSMRAMPDPWDRVPRKRHLGFIPGMQLWILPALAAGFLWSRLLAVTVSVNRDDYPRRLVRDFRFPAERLRVIHNGIPIAPLPPARPPACGVHLLFLGRLSAGKGLLYLLEALARLPAHYRLEIVGEGAQEAELRSRVAELTLTERVRFSGFLAQPAAAILRSDIMVVPSVWEEAFGRVVPEAMALCVPVVATAVGGMQELFDDGVEGLYVPPRDVERLVDAIRRLGDDPAQRTLMGQRARARVLSDYNVTRVAAQYMEVYEALLFGNATPGGGEPGDSDGSRRGR